MRSHSVSSERHLGLRSRLDLAPKRHESRLSHHLMALPASTETWS